MTYILQKRPLSLSIKAGKLAQQLIEQEGLQARHVDIIPGAAGGPKGIGLQGLDQAIFAGFLPQAPQRRSLIGSSIGSWRFASILAWGAHEGTRRLAELYTHLEFQKKMSYQDVGKVCEDMLSELIGGKENTITAHPDYHLTILAIQAKHLFKSDHFLPLFTSLAGIVTVNTIKRDLTRLFMHRVIAQPEHYPQIELHHQNDFPTIYQMLSEQNLSAWLMASGSIPAVMSGVRNIPNAPKGCYRDGGLIDYHIDLPFPSQGIVLYPHFTDSITPGWFDKFVRWRKVNSENQKRTLLISPSQDYLSRLPLGRLPDRKDFIQFQHDPKLRIKLWQQTIAESQRLGNELLELIEKQQISHYLEKIT